MISERKTKLIQEIKGISLGAAGLFLLISLLSFNSDDLSFNTYSTGAQVHNYGGTLGAYLADLLFEWLFGLASYGIPIAMLLVAYKLLRFKELKWRNYKGVAFLVFLVSLASFFALSLETTVFLGQKVSTGGLIGIEVAKTLT
ncbi:MAG: DNA translocase FtsK, partial [Deltaproteobacteria bacterium]|nr:DNA translocase FtsK [Deltaproteobacteria bacterium]